MRFLIHSFSFCTPNHIFYMSSKRKDSKYIAVEIVETERNRNTISQMLYTHRKLILDFNTKHTDTNIHIPHSLNSNLCMISFSMTL